LDLCWAGGVVRAFEDDLEEAVDDAVEDEDT
jgi:hypothetical protein